MEDLIEEFLVFQTECSNSSPNLLPCFKTVICNYSSLMLLILFIARNGVDGFLKNNNSVPSQEPVFDKERGEQIKSFLLKFAQSLWKKWKCDELTKDEMLDFYDILIHHWLFIAKALNENQLAGYYEHLLTHIVALLRLHGNLIKFSTSNLERQIGSNKHIYTKSTNKNSRFDSNQEKPHSESSIQSYERILLKPVCVKLAQLYEELYRFPDEITSKNECNPVYLNGKKVSLKLLRNDYDNYKDTSAFLENLYGTEFEQILITKEKKRTYKTKNNFNLSQNLLSLNSPNPFASNNSQCNSPNLFASSNSQCNSPSSTYQTYILKTNRNSNITNLIEQLSIKINYYLPGEQENLRIRPPETPLVYEDWISDTLSDECTEFLENNITKPQIVEYIQNYQN